MAGRTWGIAALAVAALAAGGCDLGRVLAGFRDPVFEVAAALPAAIPYRQSEGGLVILTGRVNGKADVDFILDTGAPVTVLVENRQTAALGLDTSKARPLGPEGDPATPLGVIADGFRIAFPGVALAQVTAVVIPGDRLPCQERFRAIDFGGVIGADLFRKFVVEVDPVARLVRLHDPKTWSPPKDATAVPLEFSEGHPFVDAQVRLDSGRMVPLRLHVDLGMSKSASLVAGESSLVPMPAGGEAREVCYVGGIREERSGPPVALMLGSARFDVADPTYVTPGAGPGLREDGAIGGGALSGRRIFIDYPSRRLHLGAPVA